MPCASGFVFLDGRAVDSQAITLEDIAKLRGVAAVAACAHDGPVAARWRSLVQAPAPRKEDTEWVGAPSSWVGAPSSRTKSGSIGAPADIPGRVDRRVPSILGGIACQIRALSCARPRCGRCVEWPLAPLTQPAEWRARFLRRRGHDYVASSRGLTGGGRHHRLRTGRGRSSRPTRALRRRAMC
jgi:hypothetical protein